MTRRAKVERMYTVSDVAKIMSVSRSIVFKWLSLDEPKDAVIPVDKWVRLSGSKHIRIKESALVQLQKELN